MQIKDLHFEPYLSQQSIQEKIIQLAETINRDQKGNDPIFIAVLNGAFIFMADLARHISIPSEITFVKVKSYEQLQSTGEHREFIGLEVPIEGRHLIIVEDIVDSGNTIQFLLKQLRSQHPASISIATLLFKPEALKHSIEIDYAGFHIPNDFVVGYGLDYDGFGRNLPDIYKLSSGE
ncbi:hypoxanthine phosphoribosyltransferase [Tunicatimonas pelagia]|uniref:hypoxanthine phosphoribosyltransferase n=1 Tax=Tunicatimonas pelagia TaxID=931531 RepID=UPI0026669D05|nr:hypoxanthine phosphoribosyltransferase [Tunicatimonas pelagia]WKN42520.1 hypoxanthine phosphoribosyltransferase [Tunicatimonas pelagia]